MDFEEYVGGRAQALLRLAYVLCGQREAAEDLTQTALVQAFRHWGRVAGADHPDAYVRRILVNEYLQQRRRRERQLRHVMSFRRDAGPESEPDPAESTSARDAFRVSVARLPPRARAVIVLRYYLDLDDTTIATMLGISTSTVRSTAARALADLKEGMSVHDDDRNDREVKPS